MGDVASSLDGGPPDSGRWARHWKHPQSCNTGFASMGAHRSIAQIPSQIFASPSRTGRQLTAPKRDFSPEARWRTGQVEATVSLVKTAAACSILELFTWASAAHNEMFTHSGASPHANHALRPLDSSLENGPAQLEQETIRGSPAELSMRRRAFAGHSYAEADADRELPGCATVPRPRRSHGEGSLVQQWCW